MFIKETEPYEDRLVTFARMKFSKGKVGKAVFRRGKQNYEIHWEHLESIFSDKLVFVDDKREWKAEIQAMTTRSMHLHVNSLLSDKEILYSGRIEKTNPLSSLFF
ncbi:hypothetical protein LPTSP4_05440 [Leptospira ryugenii]|uniref:Uncharacterized protein n=1 Tax=Leptospira ryugenii TaxID=1917863 RepID=A0A2P2DWL4_9LEPT|nr:hypothetical protein [Leptospira ryugenii]GBF49035.1 hypothetical protein LPTSP4_05440 [Leptospira ryugenii]